MTCHFGLDHARHNYNKAGSLQKTQDIFRKKGMERGGNVSYM